MIDETLKVALESEIGNLTISEEAKNVLSTILLLGDEGEGCLDIIPNLLVVSDPGAGVSTYSSIYSAIIDGSGVYKVGGVETFLELDFPNVESRMEYDLFFESPRIVAETQNRFWGTFVISFSRYEGADLLGSEQFERLTEFVYTNRENIHFIFHVTPEFSDIAELERILGQIVDIKKVEFGEIKLEDLSGYFVNELARNGVELSDDCANMIRDSLIADMMNEECFSGFRSMDILINRLCYEIVSEILRCKGQEGQDSKKDMDKIVEKIVAGILANRSENRYSRQKIGF